MTSEEPGKANPVSKDTMTPLKKKSQEELEAKARASAENLKKLNESKSKEKVASEINTRIGQSKKLKIDNDKGV